MSKFELGKTVVTIGIDKAISENPLFHYEILQALQKYKEKDWGDTCEEDAETNEEAVSQGERILAVYNTSKGKIWIITEWDRSVTTILFPSEY